MGVSLFRALSGSLVWRVDMHRRNDPKAIKYRIEEIELNKAVTYMWNIGANFDLPHSVFMGIFNAYERGKYIDRVETDFGTLDVVKESPLLSNETKH